MKNVKLALILMAIIGFLGFVLFSKDKTPDSKIAGGLKIGDPAPDVKLTDLNGKVWEVSKLRGSVVIVNFWASWCPSCKTEMPSLKRLNGKYGGRNDFKVLAVIYNDLPDKASAFAKSQGLDFTLIYNNGDANKRYGVTGVPETYIIDKKGILRNKTMGPVDFDAPFVTDLIDKLLTEPAN